MDKLEVVTKKTIEIDVEPFNKEIQGLVHNQNQIVDHCKKAFEDSDKKYKEFFEELVRRLEKLESQSKDDVSGDCDNNDCGCKR